LFQKWLETKKDPVTQFKYFVKYINDTEEGAFTMDDLEALQAVGFKMRGVNYDNLEY